MRKNNAQKVRPDVTDLNKKLTEAKSASGKKTITAVVRAAIEMYHQIVTMGIVAKVEKIIAENGGKDVKA